MYVGYPPHLVCEVIGRGSYFAWYEYLKRWFASHRRQRNNDNSTVTNDFQCNMNTHAELTLIERMVCASMAGMISWTSIYPMDVVRNKIYALQAAKMDAAASTTTTSNAAQESLPSTISMMQQMYKTGGIQPFFRGYTLTIFRAGPVAAVVLPVYDITLLWLNGVL